MCLQFSSTLNSQKDCPISQVLHYCSNPSNTPPKQRAPNAEKTSAVLHYTGSYVLFWKQDMENLHKGMEPWGESARSKSSHITCSGSLTEDFSTVVLPVPRMGSSAGSNLKSSLHLERFWREGSECEMSTETHSCAILPPKKYPHTAHSSYPRSYTANGLFIRYHMRWCFSINTRSTSLELRSCSALLHRDQHRRSEMQWRFKMRFSFFLVLITSLSHTTDLLNSHMEKRKQIKAMCAEWYSKPLLLTHFHISFLCCWPYTQQILQICNTSSCNASVSSTEIVWHIYSVRNRM